MTNEELNALVRDAVLAADCMQETGTFETGQGILHDCARAITTLRAQLAEAHTRIEAMESGDWSELKLVRFKNGQMDITAGPIPAVAEYLAQMMQDGEGKYFNFMEVSINHNTAGPMTLSLQRKNGKTPNQLRKEAEARADKAEAALAAQIEADAGMIERIVTEARQKVGNIKLSKADAAVVDMLLGIATAIRNQPHDRTALDRMLTETREKALREAAEILDDEGWLGMSMHRILALIEKTKCV